MIYKFGPDGRHVFKRSAAAQIARRYRRIPLWLLIVLTVVFAVVLQDDALGPASLAIGGNEQAALLTGVPVKLVKVQAYVVSGLAAALAAILNVGWPGSAINALGHRLRAAGDLVGGDRRRQPDGRRGRRLRRVHRLGADLRSSATRC